MSDPDGGGTVEDAIESATGGSDGVDATGPESDGHGATTAEEVEEVRTALADLRETTDRLEESVGSLRSDLESLDSAIDEDVEDLRERFVRLYRDLEGKAGTDHEHPETADRLETVAADVTAAAERLDGVETRVESVEEALDRVDATVTDLETNVGAIDDRVASAEGRISDTDDRVADAEDRLSTVEERLSTAEDRLEDLAAAGEDRSEKLSRVASAVVRAQRELRTVRRDRADRERLDSVLRTANRHGVRKADCAECGNTVRPSLLSEPECPFCEARFDDLDPADRFYRRSTLTVDDRPALEGDVAPNADEGERDGEETRRDGEGIRREGEGIREDPEGDERDRGER
ncbi:hypothetical protein SAMN04488066_1298 [Halorubrum aquaticum]|uniref:t-SNARE coiled-coil homology domain-containing protein n=1 Tax=Halorubrum aquaticum TaxID=387340 RepID=A0A1I3CT81_9EURY|nr:hypothetical protein [Halorubrum aquaticum]SFH77657.1 hypothetical protein SAMN04488066_1298 [Halorubrum aquaticum]